MLNIRYFQISKTCICFFLQTVFGNLHSSFFKCLSQHLILLNKFLSLYMMCLMQIRKYNFLMLKLYSEDLAIIFTGQAHLIKSLESLETKSKIILCLICTNFFFIKISFKEHMHVFLRHLMIKIKH